MSTIGKDLRSTRQSPARRLAEELRARREQKVEDKPQQKLDGFGGFPGREFTGSGSAPLGLMPGAVKQGGVTGATALLGAMTGDLQVQAAEGPRLKKSGDGLILTGDLTVSSAADLEILRGVELLRGELVIEESGLAGADLSAAEGLRVIEGNLGVEGNRALEALDALKRLERLGGNLYVGFNAGLRALELPALQRVDGALIIEGNDQLETLSLPKLESVGRYLHLHENAKLTAVDAPRLTPPEEVEAFQNGADHLAGLPAA